MADRSVRVWKSHRYRWLFFVVLVFVAGCQESVQTHKLQGATMGTTWNVTYTGSVSPSGVKADIESVLDAVNGSMSTYLADSEISRFNSSGIGDTSRVSSSFGDVLTAALAIGERSDGAYDVTVGPLVDLWGFGAGSEAEWRMPSAEQVAGAMARVGQDALVWDADSSTLARRKPVQLDFSSIAKGYGVDRIAETLKKKGLSDFLVEVGGEMRVSGVSPRGDAWRIAIEKPVPGQRGVAEALELEDVAVATSGDYRNFFEHEGVRYSHTLDPRTGYPVTHNLVSVTVLHEHCMMADGWATALSVAGPEEALRLAEANDLAVYLMVRDGDGLKSFVSPAFSARFDTMTNE